MAGDGMVGWPGADASVGQAADPNGGMDRRLERPGGSNDAETPIVNGGAGWSGARGLSAAHAFAGAANELRLRADPGRDRLPMHDHRVAAQLTNRPARTERACLWRHSWSVFGQTVQTPIVAVYGENNDDTNDRVRIGVDLGPGTHTGRLAKDNFLDSCASTVGPAFDVDTTFTGTHVAVVDKSRDPMCVFSSRLVLTEFTQDLQVGVPVDVGGTTRDGMRRSLERRLDLEVARAVNRYLNPSALPFDVDFEDDFGRCDNDWRPFVDP